MYVPTVQTVIISWKRDFMRSGFQPTFRNLQENAAEAVAQWERMAAAVGAPIVSNPEYDALVEFREILTPLVGLDEVKEKGNASAS